MTSKMNYPQALAFIASLIIARAATCEAAGPLVLVDHGHSAHRIALEPGATPIDRKAAAELQKYLEESGGVRMPISEAPFLPEDRVIFIGSAGHVSRQWEAIDWKRLGEDGFTIRTEGNRLLIAGGTNRGSLFGVYTFLESYIGCRKYTPTVEFIPKKTSIVLPDIDDTQVPRIAFRDDYFYDPGYMAWHKLDKHDDLFGMYVHTFQSLVPPEKYFHNHPEYFSKVKSGRIPNGQLCLTNGDVFHIVVKELQARMKLEPDKRFWSVSQNDTFSPCECDACRAIDSVEGSPSGSLIAFVNRVADEFPDKVISTLAYQYSRAAPKTIKPRKNVNIMLCSIESNRSRPIANDTGPGSFVRDLESWRALTSNIYLWDYVVQFRNLVSPFPNLRVLQPNIQLFVKNGVRSVFEQGSGGRPSEFMELRTYLLAKLLWDPEANVDTLMNDFLLGYYGPAAPYLRTYIESMHDALERSGEDLAIYGYPLPSKNGYLSPENIDRYIVYFDRAEEAVKDDSAFLHRVQKARLPLQFAQLEQAKVYGTTDRGFFSLTSDGKWEVRTSMKASLQLFVERCKDFGVNALEEKGTTPDQYFATTTRYLDASMKNPLALFRPVMLTRPAKKTYCDGDPATLTDGLRGWEDYSMNWLGFEGEDMDATIDLGSVQPVRRISAGFLQDNNAWIFLPTEVVFSISGDGVQFSSVGVERNKVPPERNGAFISSASVKLQNATARFIRVKAINMKICPSWHKGAGGPAWVFADEITVE